MKKQLLALAAAPLAFAASPASAVVVFSSNFDSVAVPSGGYVIVPSVEGWTASAGDGIEIQNHAAGDPFSESNLVELDSNNNSAMSRTIGANSYLLNFVYSARPNVPSTSNGISVLLNGSSIFNITGTGGSGTSWLPQSLYFTTTAPTTLTFAATGTSDSLGGYLDSIVLNGAVPEPSTWAMMLVGFGAVGLGMRRQRRRIGQPQAA